MSAREVRIIREQETIALRQSDVVGELLEHALAAAGGTDQAESRLRVAERFLAEARVIGGGPARGGG